MRTNAEARTVRSPVRTKYVSIRRENSPLRRRERKRKEQKKEKGEERGRGKSEEGR
jgi:hypothetical protein